MNNIMLNDKNKLMPEIRFKGFTHAWEQRKFSNTLEFSISNNTLSRAELNYDEGEIKNIHYGDILIKFDSITDINNPEVPFITGGKAEDYKSQLLQNGDIIIADTAEDETTGKAIEITGISDNYVVSGLHTMVARPNETFAQGYLGYYLNSQAYRNQLLPLMQGIKVLSLSKTNMDKTTIVFTKDISEQTAIGTFFRTLDDSIALYKRKLEGLKEIKRAYLQQMFPRDGETVPRVRFKGFVGDWERKKLGEVFSERNERSSNGELISVTINSGVVKASTLDRKDNSSEDKSNYKKVEVCDIAYNSMRMWQGASGVSNYSGILSPAYTVIIPNDGVRSLFFSYMFKLSQMIQTFQTNSQGLTSDTWNLKFPLLKDISIFIPCADEQTAIGNFFRNLDEQITTLQTKLDKLKQLKSAYLQKMFI